MSLSSTLSISQTGLSAASTQLQVAANNIANAGTEGYSKKSVVLASANLGNVGGGVQIVGFSNASNQILFGTLTKATSNAGMRSAQDDYLQQVQDVLGTSESDDPPISGAMTDFVNAWTSYAAEPESAVAQRQVIQNATNLVTEFRSVSEKVEALDRQCSAEISSSLADLNGYLSQVKDINSKIAQAVTANQSTGDLQDQMNQVVLKIAEITGVTTLNRANGQIALYTTGGYQLVDGSYARSFSYDGVDITSTDNPGMSLNTALTGGKIQALVDFRDTSATATSSTDPAVGVIQRLRDQLDTIAASLTSTVTTATSGEATFASAYNAATTTAGSTELTANFFTGVDPLDITGARAAIAVNTALLNGTATLKVSCGDAVVTALVDGTRAFTTTGLNATGSSYANLVTASLTTFQQAASNVAKLNDTASSQKTYLSEKITNETNVNVDTEMVNLVSLQNIYAANARVISVVKDLFSILQGLLT